MKNKKSQGINVNVIIVASIALIVLVILVAIFTGRLGEFPYKEEFNPDEDVCLELKDMYGNVYSCDFCDVSLKFFDNNKDVICVSGDEKIQESLVSRKLTILNWRPKTFCEKCLDEKNWDLKKEYNRGYGLQEIQLKSCNEMCVCEEYENKTIKKINQTIIDECCMKKAIIQEDEFVKYSGNSLLCAEGKEKIVIDGIEIGGENCVDNSKMIYEKIEQDCIKLREKNECEKNNPDYVLDIKYEEETKIYPNKSIIIPINNEEERIRIYDWSFCAENKTIITKDCVPLYDSHSCNNITGEICDYNTFIICIKRYGKIINKTKVIKEKICRKKTIYDYSCERLSYTYYYLLYNNVGGYCTEVYWFKEDICYSQEQIYDIAKEKGCKI